jgi:hypothetical protein
MLRDLSFKVPVLAAPAPKCASCADSGLVWRDGHPLVRLGAGLNLIALMRLSMPCPDCDCKGKKEWVKAYQEEGITE